MPDAVYYNIDGGLDYENNLLREWHVSDLRLIGITERNHDNFIGDISGADGLVVEYEQVTHTVQESCPHLKCIALQSIGYNNIDIQAATRLGICVTNAPGFCAEEVALHAIGLIIDLTRKITFFDKSVRSGSWNPLLGYPTSRLTGKTAGLVFFGQIPQKMVPVLHALGMSVIVYAPTKTKEYLAGFGCRKAETLDELLQQSDVVSLHCPLIKDVTYHLIGETELKMMKPSAFLINTARGSVVDEQALVKALDNKWIKGAGIDVIEDETNEKSNLFRFNDNVVITPHAAFISEDSFYAARRIALEQLVQRLVNKELPSHLVNTAVVPRT